MSDKKAMNVKLKSVPIMLDKPRNLRYDMNAYVYLEDTFGGVQEALESLQQGRVKSVLEILKAGCLHEDENVTTQQIGSGIGLPDLEVLAAKINEALGLSMPEVNKDGKEGKNG